MTKDSRKEELAKALQDAKKFVESSDTHQALQKLFRDLDQKKLDLADQEHIDPNLLTIPVTG